MIDDGRFLLKFYSQNTYKRLFRNGVPRSISAGSYSTQIFYFHQKFLFSVDSFVSTIGLFIYVKLYGNTIRFYEYKKKCVILFNLFNRVLGMQKINLFTKIINKEKGLRYYKNFISRLRLCE